MHKPLLLDLEEFEKLVPKGMNYATIKWSSAILYPGLKDSTDIRLDENGFYMILTGKYDAFENRYVDIELQYIGQTYKQTIKKRALQEHPAYSKINEYLESHLGYKVLIKSGIITEMSQIRETKEFFDDIEWCLIFRNKPITNDINDKESYKGKRNITVTNINYTPLEEKSICKKNNQTS